MTFTTYLSKTIYDDKCLSPVFVSNFSVIPHPLVEMMSNFYLFIT